MSKIYIGLITSAGNAEYFDWYKGISKYIDGLAVTWHGERDEGFDILNENKGDGFIVEREYYGHHGHSMNDFLLNPRIRPDLSWFILRDSLEQISQPMISNLRLLVGQFEAAGINTVSQYSKILMFKKAHFQIFTNAIHWGLHGVKPTLLKIEDYPDLDKCFYTVRDSARHPSTSISHYLRYYLADSSNHLALGREGNQAEFEAHEAARQKFLIYCHETLKIDLTERALKEYLIENDISYELKWFVNFEPILNHWVCYEILGHSFEEVDARRNKKELFKIC